MAEDNRISIVVEPVQSNPSGIIIVPAPPTGTGKYKKVCGRGGKRKSRRGCGKEFFSDVRHEKFCSSCKVPAAVKARQNRKRREEYARDRERLILEGRARAAARKALIDRTPGHCVDCPPDVFFSISKLECDHIDGNCMNNPADGSNVAWRCEPHHKSKTRKQLAEAKSGGQSAVISGERSL